jgi:uncharacterized protein YoxC
LEIFDAKLNPIMDNIEELNAKLQDCNQEISNLKQETKNTEDNFQKIIEKVCSLYVR